MPEEEEIRENLADAGCGPEEAETILDCIRAGNMKKAEKLIGTCQKRQLAKIRESQAYIDRLDYLSWRISKERSIS